MKSEKELKKIKNEVETLNRKLCELTEDELAQVTGGGTGPNVSGVIGSAVAPGVLIQFSGGTDK